MTSFGTTHAPSAARGRVGTASLMRRRPILTLSLSLFCALVIAAVNLLAAAQTQSVVGTPHNLSAGGPGSIRATSEDEVCIFCHAPHNASPVQPLWNRAMPASTYTVYSSTSLSAIPGQPTGASKMCLSCHDGTIALGNVVSRSQPINMAGGVTHMPFGARGYLGTDLSDDHPISFRYDAALAFKNPHLADPRFLPPMLRLDHNQELQCTTCHNPHNNVHGNFLVMSNENSAMCRSCHQLPLSTIIGHEDCSSCHQPHTAPSGPFLLRGGPPGPHAVGATCISCHDGSNPAAQNIAADLNRISTHEILGSLQRSGQAVHASCNSCHDPHTMQASNGSPVNGISPTLGSMRGVSASGAPVDVSRFEYEVCYSCHADQNNVIITPRISRHIPQANIRLQFDVAAVSSHPVHAPGSGSSGRVPSLRPPWNEGSTVLCSDCHGSDTSRKAGGTGPDGVHGSNIQPLLLARYETTAFTPESPQAYALCYRCHERDGLDGILTDRSFKYHRLHIVDHRTPCATCHDAHGISSAQGSPTNNAHLMNFDISVVQPDRFTGRLAFEKTGTNSGRCYLSCHGVDHSPKEY
jgi:predicted CXXCH cytochrome family protein